MSSQPPVSVPEPSSGPREELPSGQTPKSLGATILLSLKAARDPAAHGAHATLPGASGGSEPVGRGRPRAPLAPRSPLGEAGRYCSPCVPASCPDLSAPPRDPVPGRPGGRGSLRGRAPWWAPAPPCWAQGTGCAPDTLCTRHAALFLSPPAAAARAPDTRGACPPLDALARGSQGARPEAPDTEAGARPLNMARETLSRRRRLSSRHIWIRVLSHSAQRPSVRAACAALSGVCLPTRTPRPGPGTRQASGGGADWPGASGGWMDRQTPH